MVRPLHILLLLAVAIIAVISPSVVGHFIVREPFVRQKSVMRISFSGDAMQHLPQIAAARLSADGFDYSRNFAYMDSVWRSVDFAVINFETTISDDGKYGGYPCFSSPAEFADALAAAGVNVAVLANNHICDRGIRGLKNTTAYLKKLGLKTTGAWADSVLRKEILMLGKGRLRVALLNYTYGTNGMPVPRGAWVNHIDTLLIKQDIERAMVDSAATHLIAFMHWGAEYQRKPDKGQIELGKWLRNNGIDVVVGSHPHVVQPVDTALRVIYSLGNFISNQQDKYTDTGMTAVLTVYEDKDIEIEMIAHWCDKLATGREKYRVLTAKDTTLLTGDHLLRMQQSLSQTPY